MKTHPLFLAAALAACTLAPTAPATQDIVPLYTDCTQLNTAADTESAYRHRTFRAYLPVEEVSKRLKVSPYSRFENPTGIYFRAGEDVTVTLKGSPRQPVALRFNCFVEKTSADIPLHEGANRFKAPCNGLAYLSYYDPEPDTAPALHLDIEGGRINGIFTQKDDNDTWRRLVAQAPAQALDLVGERCQFIFDTAALRTGNPGHGAELLKMLDDVIRWQQELLGWDKYRKHPGNHILGRAAHCGYMHQDALGAAFSIDCTAGVCDPNGLADGAWGVSHEFGHANQMRPDLCWVGMMEVTNNIFSSWSNFRLHRNEMRLEHETITNWSGDNMRGGRFDCYVNNAIVRRQIWQLQGGPDSGGPDKAPTEGGDSFVTLGPLWQLQLYLAVAHDKTDFYADVYHNTAVSDNTGLTQGMFRVNFMRRACDAAGLDLSEFFVKTGMLAPVNRHMNDYNSRMLTVTDEMVEGVLAHAARYPKPDSSVIYYINANNVDIFRDKLPVEKGAAFSPVVKDGRFVMPADSWKNAVAFEAYAGGKLVRVSVRGLGQADNASTCVYCPAGTTSVKAVQWDGTRLEICTFP